MVTPASLYILRSALNLSIDTDVRHAFSFSAASRCAACCSGVASPRPRPAPAPPPRAAGGASPRGAALQGCPAHDALNCGGGASAGAAPRGPPPAAAARGWCPGKALDRAAHQLDRADARVDDVLERGLGALIRHAAIAVGDGADLHAVNPRVRL